LALADVANDRLHAKRAVFNRRVGPSSYLHPDSAVVGTSETKEVIADGPVCGEPFEQRGTGLRIDKAIAIERTHFSFGGPAGVAEDQFKMGIRRDGGGAVNAKCPDVDAFVHRFEQTRERGGARLHGGRLYRDRDSGFGIRDSRAWGSGDVKLQKMRLAPEARG